MQAMEELPYPKDQILGETKSLLQVHLKSQNNILQQNSFNSTIPSKDEIIVTACNRNFMPRFMNAHTYEPDRLYCREKEISALKEAYKYVNENRQSRVLLIRGETGSGKSSLASFLKDHHKLHKEQQQQFGGSCFSYLLQSKFYQPRRHVPYCSYAAAVVDLLSRLESKDVTPFIQNIEQTITEPSEISVLLEVITELKQYLIQHDQETKLEPFAVKSFQKSNSNPKNITKVDPSSLKQFKYIFLKLLQCLVTTSDLDNNLPLLMILDDIHFADETDLDLLLTLVTDSSYPPVLVVCTCRDTLPEDTGSNRSFIVPHLDKINDKIQEIQLERLNETMIASLFVELFQINTGLASTLADYAAQCTNGNFFFIVKYVNFLLDSKFIEHKNERSPKDIKESKLELDSVQDVILSQFNEFPNEVQDDVRMVSCLGTSFGSNIVNSIGSGSMQSSFKTAREAELLVFDDKTDTWLFPHEKLQEIVYYSIPESERVRYHYRLGRKLWRGFSFEMLLDNIFLVVDHLMKSTDLMLDPNERIAVAKLCLSAGERAAMLSAFQSARTYFMQGISLLDRRCWRDEYELSISLHSGAAECSFSSGFIDEVYDFERVVLQNSRLFEDTIRVRIMKVNALGSVGKMSEALRAGLDVLHELGEKFPKRPSKFRIVLSMMRLLVRMEKMTDDAILNLRVMTEKKKLAAMQVLNLSLLYAFAGNRELAALFGIRMMNLTLDYGISGLTCIGMALFADALCAMGQIDNGNRFGKLSFVLYDRFRNRNFLARFYAVYYDGVHSWINPVQESIKPLMYAYKIGLETGDNEFAMLCGYDSYLASFDRSSLVEVEQGIQSLTAKMEMLNQYAALAMTKPLWQGIRTLMGLGTGDPAKVSGSVLQESQLQQLKDISPLLYHLGYYPIVLVRFIFGDVAAVSQWLACYSREFCHDFSPTVNSMFSFLEGLCCVSMVRHGNKRYLRRAKKCSKRLLHLSKMLPENYFAKHLILKAELKGLDNNVSHKDGLLDYYTAISVAKDSGSLLWYAVSNELTGKYLLRRSSDPTAALKYIRDAISIYQKWGAVAKVEYLRYEMKVFRFQDL